MLGISGAIKLDLGCSAAELVYGTPLHLSSDFFWASPSCFAYVDNLRSDMMNLRTSPTRITRQRNIFVCQDFSTATHVFVRQYSGRRLLQPAYKARIKFLQGRTKSLFWHIQTGKTTSLSTALRQRTFGHLTIRQQKQ